MPKAVLLLEFLLIFVALPLAVRFSPLATPPLPLLWGVTLYCFVVLRRDPAFPRFRLWNAAAAPPHLQSVFILFLLIGSLILLGTRLYAPQLLFSFVRQRPALWAAVMVLYPILSVYPQGLIYRAFLLHRYAPLVDGLNLDAATSRLLLIFLSAAAFGFLHIIFRNPIAVSLCFFGGLLFAWRYLQTNSLALSSFEHALYGCLLFTAGLGQYFYYGAVKFQPNPHP